MVNLKKAENILHKLQEFDNELVDLLISDDGKNKIIGRIGDTRNLRDDHLKFIDYARESIKQSQKCIFEIVKDLKQDKNSEICL